MAKRPARPARSKGTATASAESKAAAAAPGEGAAAAAEAKAQEEAAAAAAESDPDTDLAGKTISVRSASGKARRRAGMTFGREAIEIAADGLSEDQVGEIMADPQLIVSVN